ncbi:hypothetical protein SKAU_G00289980 [Synaphobranchus kaupii]|uniref:Uncharacterized protein n=1 Tax=Synaphobranchus kaupii TaxID=118154 RepID=A0A9Q1ETQ4_SYNKA|nr:hypothetical protein SKAU_G00289980 [Synaphobranchus kaupii]
MLFVRGAARPCLEPNSTCPSSVNAHPAVRRVLWESSRDGTVTALSPRRRRREDFRPGRARPQGARAAVLQTASRRTFSRGLRSPGALRRTQTSARRGEDRAVRETRGGLRTSLLSGDPRVMEAEGNALFPARSAFVLPTFSKVTPGDVGCCCIGGPLDVRLKSALSRASPWRQRNVPSSLPTAACAID